VDVRAQMERIYAGMSPADIPWNVEEPPRSLVELVESGRVAPCDAVDLGCGAGNYAVWLARRGFRVTGIDVSRAAVAKAEALARERGDACRFLVHDVLEPMPDLEACFDFAFDWEVLHHVFSEDRARYAAGVHRLLRPGGLYLSVCFAEDDPGLPGDGKYRRTQLGTVLYLSSEAELRELFDPLFSVEASGIIDVAGKRGPHRAVRMVMTRRE
jgi:SAM-dependent methyltransferase